MSELSDKNFKAAIIQRGSLKGNFNFIELNENTLYQNMWDAAKAVLRDIYSTKCIPRNEERSQINNFSSYLNTTKRK